MILTTIILLIILGISLMILEFFVVPGVTIAGIGGFILLTAAVILSYTNYSNNVGHIVLIGVMAFIIVSISFALRERTWRKVALNTTIDFKINDNLTQEIKVGDTGVTISRLAPSGKVLVNDKYYEAFSENKLIDEKTEIKITKIKNTKIIVQQLYYNTSVN